MVNIANKHTFSEYYNIFGTVSYFMLHTYLVHTCPHVLLTLCYDEVNYVASASVRVCLLLVEPNPISVCSSNYISTVYGIV